MAVVVPFSFLELPTSGSSDPASCPVYQLTSFLKLPTKHAEAQADCKLPVIGIGKQIACKTDCLPSRLPSKLSHMYHLY